MRSTNPMDVFTWISKNIKSCINHHQVITCNKLIQNFEKHYPKYDKLSYILRCEENLKYWDIIENKNK